MVAQISTDTTTEITYPDCDGQPMSDNTKQFRWIVTITIGIENFSSSICRDLSDHSYLLSVCRTSLILRLIHSIEPTLNLSIEAINFTGASEID